MSGPSFDPYRILGIERAADSAEITRAYRKRAKELHPDLHGVDAVAAMQELNRAVRVLSDRETRRAWDATHPPAPREHWAYGRTSRPDPGSLTNPATWASWEAQPTTPGPGEVRVRTVGTRRREAASAVPIGGVRDSAWLAVGVALILVVGALVLGWIASSSTLASSGRQAIDRVGLTSIGGYMLDPDHEVGVFLRSGGVIGLVIAERGENGWSARVLREVTTSHPLSVLLFVDDATDGSPLPSIAFGRAEGGVAEVRVSGVRERHATVVQGTWSMPVPGITDPGQLAWEFVLADGTIVQGGGQLAD